LKAAKSVAEYLAGQNAVFAAIYRKHQHLFLLINYYGRGGDAEMVASTAPVTK